MSSNSSSDHLFDGLGHELLDHVPEGGGGLGRHGSDDTANACPNGRIVDGQRSHLVVCDEGLDRDTWLASRRRGLGGSDLAAILGEDPWRTEVDVWLSKLDGYEEPEEDSERREAGTFLEPVVVGWYARGGEAWPPAGDRGPLLVVKPPQVAHRDRTWQRGSADGLVIGGPTHDLAGHLLDMLAVKDYALGTVYDWAIERGVEVKTHGWSMGRKYGRRPGESDEIPGDKRIQCAWYQALWAVEEWDLIALLDTHLRRQWTIYRDPQFEADLLEIAEAWWVRHVVKGEEPRPDGSRSYGEHLRRKFPADNGSVVKATDDIDAIAFRLRELRQEEKRIEREREKAEQQLIEYLGEGAILDSAAGKITFKQQAGHVSWKAVAEEALRDLGLSPAGRDERAERHRGKPFRVLRVPRDFTE